MSWNVTTKQYIPAQIGEPWGGGYFAGYISHTADGNPTHALIVAPRATGASGGGYTLTTNYQWKTSSTATANSASAFDGRANTDAIIAAGIDDHPAAKFCVDLTIGGYTDWYLPARLELEIAYFNLKATTNTNGTGSSNIYSVPIRTSNYTSTYPTQTFVTNFRSGGSEAFSSTLNTLTDSAHWTSTDNNTAAWSISMANGFQTASTFGTTFINNKTFSHRVRAFRRVSLSGYTTI